MKKSNLFYVFFVCALAFGVIFMSCGGGESDTWSPVTSLNQLHGTWSGSHSERMSIKDYVEMMGETFTAEYAALFGNMHVNFSYNVIMTLNASARTIRSLENVTQAFSGGNISAIWPFIKTMLQVPGTTFNDNNHSASFVLDYTNTISDNDWANIQINQNGTKARVPFFFGNRIVYLVLARH